MARSLQEIEDLFWEQQKEKRKNNVGAALELPDSRVGNRSNRPAQNDNGPVIAGDRVIAGSTRNLTLDKVLLVLFFIIGMVIFIYPSISDYVARKNVIQGVSTYEREISTLSKEERDKLLKEAEEYNASLGNETVEDPFVPGSGRAISANYSKVMNTEDGIIGYVDIPQLKIYLPIRHGSEEEVLTKGAGHVEQTHFPIGGEGNLAVVTAHTGFTGADMFNRLIEMKVKDTFMIHILEETLTYEVDDISVIDPEDIEKLLPVKGKDYVTLLTCTPYGVNSHRLIVRGDRIANAPDVVRIAGEVPFPWRVVIMCGIAVLLFILILVWNEYRSKKGKGKYK